jgi:hypothetical protein
MIYLTAIFVPPLYFLIKKNWLGFIVSGFLLLLSPILLMTVVLAPGALIFWGLCAICAIWDLRKHVAREHAAILAEEMASKMGAVMRQQQSTAVPPRL